MAKGKPFPFPPKGGKSKPVDKPTEIGKGNPFAAKGPPAAMPFKKGGRAR